jgi:hypothetical protein
VNCFDSVDSTPKEGKPVSRGMNTARGRAGKFVDHGSCGAASHESDEAKFKARGRGRGRGGSSRSPSRVHKTPHPRGDGTPPNPNSR